MDHPHSSYSTVLATKYGGEALKLIRSATRSLTSVLYVVGALVIFSLLDLFGVLYHFRLYSEIQHDYIISIIALVLLGVLVPLIWRVLKAKNALDSWQDVFEGGSLRLGISMAMAHRDKGEALNAVAETVPELEPLRQHLATVGTSKFTDVQVAGVIFDGLVDERLVETEELKRLLREFGAVIVALMDIADISSVKEFNQNIRTYSDNMGQSVGMAVIVAKEITDEARQAAGKVLLVEKDNNG
jgi:uncharacterized membrane protein